MLFQTPVALFQCTTNEEHFNYVLVIFLFVTTMNDY